jgi:hypothetical protein
MTVARRWKALTPLLPTPTRSASTLMRESSPAHSFVHWKYRERAQDHCTARDTTGRVCEQSRCPSGDRHHQLQQQTRCCGLVCAHPTLRTAPRRAPMPRVGLRRHVLLAAVGRRAQRGAHAGRRTGSSRWGWPLSTRPSRWAAGRIRGGNGRSGTRAVWAVDYWSINWATIACSQGRRELRIQSSHGVWRGYSRLTLR